MKPGNDSKQLLRGAFILTVAALLTKILSAGYRIPFQNITGDIGFYIYQQVYPFYGLALILSTYGFPVVISKLYTERKWDKEPAAGPRLLIFSFIYLFIFGLIAFFGLYFQAEWIAASMGDHKLAGLFRIISFVYLLFPFIAVLRGYFQGQGNMVPTAVSQVGEQLLRVITILLLAILLTEKGFSLYHIGGGAAFGSITGGIAAAIILGYFFIYKRKQQKLCRISFSYHEWTEAKDIAKALTVQGFAICISGMLLIFLQLADSLNLYSLLVSSGIDGDEAKKLKGIYDRGQPLLQLGTVVATSLSLSLVPLIASSAFRHKKELLKKKIALALQISIVAGAGATFGLSVIIRPVNQMLFENTLGSNVLVLLSLIILMSSVIITISSVLQGLGFSLYPAVVILLGFAGKWMLNIWLVPVFGTMGAALASNISLVFMLILMIVKLRNETGITFLPARFYLITGFALAVMVAALKVFLWGTGAIGFSGETNRIGAAAQALLGAGLGGFLYLSVILKGSVFKEEELVLFPLGSRLSWLLPNRNRRRSE
ncbi:polysaccharide biosynthesis protein [Bacillus canaveralius]|uniref:Polysaccharide biosynthesis protein n=1 Tax=Bacillus canaveralius TaxID=1403243 RepID=A0A2N5GHJ8_9BACI|nr:polysaccharide biosynthesis protein [Bacillus canaveralius]PLR80250.1 polysaccharide biosynthesis protein [Bacillus canaveralius]PLS00475.1 polysaccharide biosynthesis protein [Bacillus canaveralius]